jgi:hypothetical protein
MLSPLKLDIFIVTTICKCSVPSAERSSRDSR